MSRPSKLLNRTCTFTFENSKIEVPFFDNEASRYQLLQKHYIREESAKKENVKRKWFETLWNQSFRRPWSSGSIVHVNEN